MCSSMVGSWTKSCSRQAVSESEEVCSLDMVQTCEVPDQLSSRSTSRQWCFARVFHTQSVTAVLEAVFSSRAPLIEMVVHRVLSPRVARSKNYPLCATIQPRVTGLSITKRRLIGIECLPKGFCVWDATHGVYTLRRTVRFCEAAELGATHSVALRVQ